MTNSKLQRGLLKPPPRPLWQSHDRRSTLYHAAQEDFLCSLPDGSVDCIWTDPPYLLSNNGTTCIAGKRQSVNKGQWDQSQGWADDHRFNLAWLRECQRCLSPEGTIWISGTLHIYVSVGMALRELGFRVLNDIVWEKPNPPPNLGCRCFTHSTEIILWATKAAKGSPTRHVFNYARMKADNNGRQMKNVWRMPAPGKNEKALGKHPTQKPLALIERCLSASTNVGAHVVDPFSGSGSTGVAALRLNRRFSGCEVDANYANLAARRLALEDSTAETCT
ncbi:MAG: site-specific DNA-methyltransferase [Gammaproteobacteria bacterium]|nr:site-specific DNA-methyltransferase [Gammaproteobacteria bacterium]